MNAEPGKLQGGTPPPVRVRGDRLVPLWLFGGWLGAAVTAALLDHWGVLIPHCGLRLLTGLPCPLCGGTRALAAVARFDLGAALALNPLVSAAGVVLGIWFLASGVNHRRPVRPRETLVRILSGKQGGWLIVVLIALNWAYLLAWAPR